MVSELPWNPKTGTLKREMADGMMNPACAHALEAALQIKNKHGADITAITMIGPDAVLDCAGNMIFNGATTDPSSGSYGILLVNGATAMNCVVEGFGDGVYMDGGNNVLKDSKVFGNEITPVQTLQSVLRETRQLN